MNRERPGRSPRRLLAALFVLLALLALPAKGLATGSWIGVSGNKLVNGRGESVRLLGVNRPGAEYQCLSGAEIFEGPTDRRSIEAIKSWHVNAVRLPINETCWLGINGVPAAAGGGAYRSAIHGYVKRLERPASTSSSTYSGPRPEA